MTNAERNARWYKRYTEEVERSISYYTWKNAHQPVHTTYLSPEDMEKKIKEMVEEKPNCHKLRLGGRYKLCV